MNNAKQAKLDALIDHHFSDLVIKLWGKEDPFLAQLAENCSRSERNGSAGFSVAGCAGEVKKRCSQNSPVLGMLLPEGKIPQTLLVYHDEAQIVFFNQHLSLEIELAKLFLQVKDLTTVFSGEEPDIASARMFRLTEDLARSINESEIRLISGNPTASVNAMQKRGLSRPVVSVFDLVRELQQIGELCRINGTSPVKLIAVDRAEMLSDHTWLSLLKHLPPKVRLILSGCPDNCGMSKSGTVFSDLVKAWKIATIRREKPLTEQEKSFAKSRELLSELLKIASTPQQIIISPERFGTTGSFTLNEAFQKHFTAKRQSCPAILTADCGGLVSGTRGRMIFENGIRRFIPEYSDIPLPETPDDHQWRPFWVLLPEEASGITAKRVYFVVPEKNPGNYRQKDLRCAGSCAEETLIKLQLKDAASALPDYERCGILEQLLADKSQ